MLTYILVLYVFITYTIRNRKKNRKTEQNFSSISRKISSYKSYSVKGIKMTVLHYKCYRYTKKCKKKKNLSGSSC